MRTIFTFLNHLRGSLGNLQSSDVSHDRRLTVGSPSGLDAKWKQNPFMRFAVVLTLIFTIGSGNVWGADPATGSWTFGTSGNANWTAVSNGTGYCGGWGCKGSTTSYTVRTTNNVSDFTTILTDPSNSNFSLTITVRGVCNSGTNKCTVTLLNSSNTKVGSLEQTKSDGFGSGTNAASAKDVVFTFTPTSTVARIQVIGYNKTAITKVSYSLSYTSGPACSDPATALSISASPASITTGGTSTLSTSGGNGGAVTYTITSANASSASIAGNTFSATAAGTYTVQASQDENGGTCGGTASTNITVTLPTRTVTWKVNGSEHATTQVVSGGHPVFPSVPSSCDAGKVFVGWTETNIGSSETDTPPTFITTATTISSDKTYYAVFAKKGDFIRVTGPSSLANGQLLVIVSNKYSTAITNGIGYTTAPTESSSKVTATDAMTWLLTGNSSSGWTISKIANGYLLGYASNPSSNSSTAATLASNNSCSTWGIGQNSYTSNVLYISNKSTATCALEASSSSANWVVYNSSSYNTNQYCALKVYASTLTKFVTSCCTPLGTINGSVSLSHFLHFFAFSYYISISKIARVRRQDCDGLYHSA